MLVILAKILLTLGAVLGWMWVLAGYQRRRQPHPEWVRKGMHLGGGLIALAMPWLFDERWPVMVLGVLAAAGLGLVRSVRVLREGLGSVTGSVARKTWGEIWFPLGAAATYGISAGDPLVYSIAILILTLADAGAGLVGTFYGTRRYRVFQGEKSVEGSLTFFLLALLCVDLPLWLAGPMGGASVLAVALSVALLATLLDAVSWWGLDNLLIPVCSCLLLQHLLTPEPSAWAMLLPGLLALPVLALVLWPRLAARARMG
ncbi:MAG: hypothetical protein KatS3mg050_2962 [Litorilinea sp.]|nr:MAG: hypothetical protein KatS3mg050_2962 [Litorilinea sp.]